jgi:hypothetical protein
VLLDITPCSSLIVKLCLGRISHLHDHEADSKEKIKLFISTAVKT